jgi:hypothetical protein
MEASKEASESPFVAVIGLSLLLHAVNFYPASVTNTRISRATLWPKFDNHGPRPVLIIIQRFAND